MFYILQSLIKIDVEEHESSEEGSRKRVRMPETTSKERATSNSDASLKPERDEVVEYLRRCSKPKQCNFNLDLKRDCCSKEQLREDPELEEFLTKWDGVNDIYEEEQLSLLCSSDYTLITSLRKLVTIGSGKTCRTLLAREKSTNELVIIKIVKKKYCTMGEMILEHTMQMMAHKAIGKHAPKIKGWLQVHPDSPLAFSDKERIRYFPVMEFCSVIQDQPVALTLSQAIEEHNSGNKILSKKEWANVCMRLLELCNELQENNIHHLDLLTTNILLRFSEEDEVFPVLIDYGMAMRSEGNPQGEVLYDPAFEDIEEHPQVAPELYRQNHPLPSSDIYSVSYALGRINDHVLQLPEFSSTLSWYRDLEPSSRPNFADFYSRVQSNLNKYL